MFALHQLYLFQHYYSEETCQGYAVVDACVSKTEAEFQVSVEILVERSILSSNAATHFIQVCSLGFCLSSGGSSRNSRLQVRLPDVVRQSSDSQLEQSCSSRQLQPDIFAGRSRRPSGISQLHEEL